MKKSFILITLSIFVFFASPVFSETVEDVLKKVINAQGGEKLKTIKDSTSSGKLKVVAQGLEGTIKIVSKFPGKFKSEVVVMGINIVNAADGKIAWMNNPMAGGLKKMSESQAKSTIRGSIGFDALLNPEKHGIKYELKGKEKVEGKEYIIITKSYKDGQSSTMYLDPKTYLTSMQISKKKTGESELISKNVFSDYKNVDGIMVAHKFSQFRNGQKNIEITFDKIEYNTGVEDSIFQMPKKPETEKKTENKTEKK